MSYKQREKERILNRKKYDGIFYLVVLFALPLLMTLPLVLPLDDVLRCLLGGVLVPAGIAMFLVFLAKRKKRAVQAWFDGNGREVVATVTDKKMDLPQGDAENGPACLLQLTWLDPSSGSSRSLWEKTTSARYERYSVGSHLMLRYDPNDPSFHDIHWYR